MKKLILTCLMLTTVLFGCKPESTKKEQDLLDTYNFWLLEIVDRRKLDTGYEYIIKEYDDSLVYDDYWIYSIRLFSIGELVLGVETRGLDKVELFDLS